MTDWNMDPLLGQQTLDFVLFVFNPMVITFACSYLLTYLPAFSFYYSLPTHLLVSGK